MDDDHGRLAENIVYFGRLLRRMGLPVGPGAVIDALSAVATAGLGRQDDFRVALGAVFVKRREDVDLFDQAFAIFWRKRASLEKLLDAPAPTASSTRHLEPPAPGASRLNDALLARPIARTTDAAAEPDPRFSWSGQESFNRRDFAQMSVEEITQARRLISRLRLAHDEIATRRWTADPRGPSLDARRTLRQTLRAGGGSIVLARRARRLRPPPIVALCDISGSMKEYSQIFLHFLHVLTERRKQTQTFLFGTRLTNVTRALRGRDVDDALARVADEALDWSGGTRIASSLHAFNRDWSRRVLSQGAVVLLFTDGLERELNADLPHEMRRLQASCRRLVWLNPLLRYVGFEARAQGVRAMLPFVDDFRPLHSLASMEDLCAVLNRPKPREKFDPRLWLRAVH